MGGWSYVLDESKGTATRRPFHSHINERPEHELRGDESAADLGQDASSGVTANGKSITHTVPAGEIGNSAPIVSTVQQWYSTELQMVVKSVRNDPRFGQSTYALSGIVRTEPDPSLFQVPAAYKISDAPGRDLNDARPRR